MNGITVVRKTSEGHIEVKVSNPVGGSLAFFNRISLVNEKTRNRILPVFYSDNYISVLPGEEKTITIEYSPSGITGKTAICIKGWNVGEQYITIQ